MAATIDPVLRETSIDPVLSVTAEPIYLEDTWTIPHVVLHHPVGRTRLVIEGEDAIVAILLQQAIEAVEHLREITDARD